MTNPSRMNRRHALYSLAGLAAAPWVPPVSAAGRRKTLILLELNGGNDGLNTVIPYADPAYAGLRGRVAIKRDQVLQLSDGVGMHPALEPLMPIWQLGNMGIVQGIGYPRPNRSHFRSIEIWDTATTKEGDVQPGWVASLFRASGYASTRPMDAVVLGREYLGPVAAADMRTVVMRKPAAFLRQAKRVSAIHANTDNAALKHILSVRMKIFESARVIESAMQRGARFVGNNKKLRGLEEQFAIAAQLILGGANVPVIKMSQSGYDTHAGQLGKHRTLMAELARAIAAFQKVMVANRRWDDVLIATYSEFGRRAAENGSGGTDHGTAAPHFLIGGRVKGALYGAYPALKGLDNGDLRYTVDFRNYYATIAKEWFGIDNHGIDAVGGRTLDAVRPT